MEQRRFCQVNIGIYLTQYFDVAELGCTSGGEANGNFEGVADQCEQIALTFKSFSTKIITFKILPAFYEAKLASLS